MKLSISKTFGLLLATIVHTATATNLWLTAATIPDNIDGLFYTGREFAAYRLSPSLRVYTSTNGTVWTAHDSTLTPLSIGHDGHGTYYALTRTELAYSGDQYSYTAHLWRSTNAVAWQETGEPITYMNILPASAAFCGGDSNLLVKVYTIFGNGSWTGFAPAPLFVVDRTNPSDFSKDSSTNSIENIQWTGTRYVAVMNEQMAASANGLDWVPLFNLGHANPPNRLLTTWRSLYFIYGYFSGITMANGITEAMAFKAPVDVRFETIPLAEFACGDNAIILADRTNSFVSTDFANTWSSNPLTAARGLACDGTSFLLGDQAGTNWIVNKFTPSTNIMEESIIPSRLETALYESVSWGQTNFYHGAAIHPGNTNSGDQLVQYEVSRDLQEWCFNGLPTTSNPAIVNMDKIDADAMFFRIHTLHSE